LLAKSVIHADENPLKVIQEEKTTSYIWVYCCGEDKLNNNQTKNIVLFDYQNNRAAKCPITFLDGYSNYLQVDGYIYYEKTDAILAGCMAHAVENSLMLKQYKVKTKQAKPMCY
jgi:transposase